MIRKILITLIFCMFIAGCAEQDPDPAQKTAQGLMKHYPANVKSSQAWQGHNFMVGHTPVIPTVAVPEDELMRHIGKSVVVSGVWNGGQQWQPNEDENNIPMPVGLDNQITIRGDGLEVSSLRLVEE